MAGVEPLVAIAEAFPAVAEGNAAHGMHASVVERLEFAPQHRGQEPTLAPIEENLKGESKEESALAAEWQGAVAEVHAEDRAREHAKLGPRVRDTMADLLAVSE